MLNEHGRIINTLEVMLGAKRTGFAKALREWAPRAMEDWRVIPDLFIIDRERGDLHIIEVDVTSHMDVPKLRKYACLQWELRMYDIDVHLYVTDSSLVAFPIDLTPIEHTCSGAILARLC